MCGISCVISLNKCREGLNQEVKDDLSKRLEASLDKIRHRGPDNSGKWISHDNRVGTFFLSKLVEADWDGG